MGEKISFIDLFGTELEIEDEYAREQLSGEAAARAEDVAVLSARMDQFTALPSGSTAGDAELMDIRVGADGQTYPTAGDAVRNQVGDLKSELEGVRDSLGYPINLFNARAFKITNTSNWTILNKTKTTFNVKHNTTYTTGFPEADINLSVGEYVFNANFDESSLKSVALYKDGNYLSPLTDGSIFEIESGSSYFIRFGPSEIGTYTIKDISIIRSEEKESLNEKVDILKSEFDGITSITSLSGEETQDKAITSNGTVITAGSNYYLIKKYLVKQGKKYWISASTNYNNLLWCFYDENDLVIELGTKSTTDSAEMTNVNNYEVLAPNGANYLLVAYHTTGTKGDCKTRSVIDVKKWAGKKWVCVGDSLTAINERTTKHYFDYVAEQTGITTVNMGVSGSGYARKADTNEAFYQRISSCPTDADVVTIFGSFNDLGAGLPIGTVNDTETDTLAGCINKTITNLQTIMPLVNLGIVAPTPWDTTQPNTSGNAYEYVSILKAICDRRSIPFLDLWHCSNLRPWDADFRTLAYSRDGGSGTHPDENGHKIFAPRFKAFLETLLF